MAETKRFNEVIQTAAYLINKKGFKSTSMSDIAKELGIFKASLYHHISGKQELLFHVLNKSLKALQDELDLVLVNIRDYEFEELMTKAIAAHLKANYSNPSSRTMFRTQLDHLTEEYRVLIQEQLDQYLNSWLTIIKQGERQGILNLSFSPKIYIYFLQATVNNAYEWYREDGPLSLDNIAEMICKLYLQGMVN